MDSSYLQLENIDQETPSLLCQYTYFLNKQSEKALLNGFDTTTFKPSIYIVSLLKKDKIVFSSDEWACIVACIKYCIKFLNGSSDVAWYSSNSIVIESLSVDGERLIKITNFDSVGSSITLNHEELEKIDQLSTFLSRIVKHYCAYWYDLEVYYRTYVLKCVSSNKKRLDDVDYFSPGNRCLNYFRIFNEIPIMCSHKLLTDLA